jgi:Tol biopolymer transport system component
MKTTVTSSPAMPHPRCNLLLYALCATLSLGACGGDGGGGGTGPDTEPPTVTIESPAPGASVSGSVTLQAIASDNDQVDGVQFRIDGDPIGSEDTQAPYALAWTTSESANGEHEVTAVARDAAGNRTTSGGVSVTVSNVSPPATPGAVAITVTTGGSGTDPDGYSVLVNGSVRGTVSSAGSITVPDLAPGSYTVRLAGVGIFCSASPATRSAAVSAGSTAEIAFDVTCGPGPSGRLLVLRSGSQLVLLNTSGADSTILATDVADAVLSPDASEVFYIRHGANFASTLHRVNPDGSDPLELGELPTLAEELAWGGGNSLVFTAVRDDTRDIYAINADGSGLAPVFADARWRLSPTWSTAIERLAFSLMTITGDEEEAAIWTSSGNGTDLEQVTAGWRDLSSAWSPDGSTIVTRRQSMTLGPSEIYLVQGDGSGATNLTNSATFEFEPAWVHDGEWITFIRDGSGLWARQVASGAESQPAPAYRAMSVLGWMP